MKIPYSQLKNIVVEEMRSLKMLPLKESGLHEPGDAEEDVKVKEFEPGDEADTLAHHVDFVKALKLKEAKLMRSLAETRKRISQHSKK